MSPWTRTTSPSRLIRPAQWHLTFFRGQLAKRRRTILPLLGERAGVRADVFFNAKAPRRQGAERNPFGPRHARSVLDCASPLALCQAQVIPNAHESGAAARAVQNLAEKATRQPGAECWYLVGVKSRRLGVNFSYLLEASIFFVVKRIRKNCFKVVANFLQSINDAVN